MRVAGIGQEPLWFNLHNQRDPNVPESILKLLNLPIHMFGDPIAPPESGGSVPFPWPGNQVSEEEPRAFGLPKRH